MRPLHRPRRGVINDALADARTESFMAIDTVHTLNQGRINAPLRAYLNLLPAHHLAGRERCKPPRRTAN